MAVLLLLYGRAFMSKVAPGTCAWWRQGHVHVHGGARNTCVCMVAPGMLPATPWAPQESLARAPSAYTLERHHTPSHATER